MKYVPRIVATVAVCCLQAGCTGGIDGTRPGQGAPGSGPSPRSPGSPSGGGGASGPSGAGGTTVPAPAPTGPDVPLPAGALRRLTFQQYANSVVDLLGARVTVPAVETDGFSDDEFILTSVAASGSVASPRAVEQFDAAARELARQAFDPAARAGFVGCTPANAADACVRRFLAAFGRRAWRRTLDEAEVARYAAAVAASAQMPGDVWRGLEVATAAMLSSPHFLYRVELGSPMAGNPARRLLGDDELATRLSYGLWDTTPDPELQAAAARGDLLNKPDVLKSTIERLLASPRARPPLLGFFAEWLGTSGLDRNGLVKDAAAFPAATKSLARAMFQEVDALVASLVFDMKDADLLSLYDTRRTFVTAELAQLYGLPAGAAGAGDQPSPVTLPDGARGGFVTTGAFLALNARSSMTSPTLRGQFIRERLLCQTVPAPPDNVDTTLPPPAPGKVETMRERLTRHMADPGCAACHQLMDPAGLALEGFDGLGRARETDGGRSLDLTGALDGQSFDGAQGLARLLRTHPAAAPCLIQQLVQQLTGTHDHKAAAALAGALAPTWNQAGGRLTTFLAAFAASVPFRTVAGGN